MKKSILLLVGLLLSGMLAAQNVEPTPAPNTGALMAKPVRYLYAEIIGDHLPNYKTNKVIIDFGQESKVLKNNWICDSKGRRIQFNSTIEALNYMIRQKWEFVQAYTSGPDNDNTHFLLRIRVEEIPDEIRQQLPNTPIGRGTTPAASPETAE